MFIYKITNLINNKIYIGQTIKTIQERFKKHVQDAENGLDTHLARAIRKYGKENFIIELIDDSAKTQDELNLLEHNYIHQYDSLKTGYNETDSITKSGGNTYAGRSQEKMESTKQKLSQSKLGGKNPMATKIKCKNVVTGEEIKFNSMSECVKYFNETNHNFITRRCTGKTKCAYKKQWIFAYQENDYPTDYTIYKNNRKSCKIKVTLPNQENKIFPSYAAAEREYGLAPKTFSSKAYKQGKIFTVQQYTIEKL